jgi:prepilin-type N-terminal cleavage/methylation domain-containing protein
MRQRGYSLAEVVIVVAIGGILLLTALPALSNILRESQLDAAVRQLVGDLRDARMQATMSGWEYRLAGHAAGSADAHRNQYRMLGRSSTGVAWPAISAAPFQSATQLAGEWIDMESRHPGTRLEPGGGAAAFDLTYNSRGAATASGTTFSPFVISGRADSSKSIRVSVTGGITLE